ncbi:glycosyltransferase family 2 protein [Candidatus Poriferisodalis sp.]|uniref:glycosyltransferase family 2 protein n=1 Tax=Candidatus Poriferisodalis sp. TaxID=3101277 RepID=UPI003B028A60
MGRPAGEGAAPASLLRLVQMLGLDPQESEQLAALVTPTPPLPTFTAIVRTQGHRPRSLLEAVGSLAAQTWTHFDMVVAVHEAPHVAARVESELNAAAGAAPADYRVLHVSEGGTRTKPLNAGLDAAEGDYVCFLDDDDLAEPNWLAVFAGGAADAPGQIIRARTARQPWLASDTGEPQTPAGPVEYVYPPTFDQLAHFSYSETPICSLALPRAALNSFGLRFDEELTVCEDWDLLVRASLVLGVHCVAEVTSLYRRSNGGNSEIKANRQYWHRNRTQVIEKIASQPFVLDGPSARRLADAHFDYGGGPSERLEHISTRDLLAALPGRLRARLAKSLRLR